MSLASPFEILDSRRQREWSFHPTAFDEGETTIKTADQPEGKLIQVLRVYVLSGDKPHVPLYWDITSMTLRAHLAGLLPDAIKAGRLVTVKALGFGRETRFSVEVK